MTLDDEMSAYIGSRINHFREERGWSLESLANASGTTKSYLSGLEKGLHSVTKAKLQMIAEALGVEESDLDGRSDRERGFDRAIARLVQAGDLQMDRLDLYELRQSVQWRVGAFKDEAEWEELYLEVLPEVLEHIEDGEERPR